MEKIVNTVKTTIAENLGGPTHKLAPPEHQFSLTETPSQSGKVALITGGSEGIGYGITHTLLTHQISKLFILSLSQEVVDEALSALSTELGPAAAQKVTWIQCDMSDWKRVAQVASEIQSQTDRLDILVLNAARGIMTAQIDEKHGIDLHMSINHFGHVTLTSHLLPLLKKTAEKGNTVRIVALGSNAHEMTASDTKFESVEEINKDTGPNGQYGRSKLAQMLYMRWLSKHLAVGKGGGRILANSVHPGFVDTKASRVDIHEAYPLGGYGMSVLMAPFKKSQFEGCVSAVFAATKTEKTGEYICPPAIPEPGSKLYQDEVLMEQLMKFTVEVTKEKTQKDSVEKGCPFNLS